MKRIGGFVPLFHLLCWLIFLSLPVVFITWEVRTRLSALVRPESCYFLLYVFIFYLHTNFLFPKLYFGKKYILYFVSLALLGSAVFYLRPFDELAGIHHKSEIFRERKDTNYVKVEIIPPAEYPNPARDVHKTAPRSFVFSHAHKRRPEPKLDIISIILFILVVAVSIIVVITKRWRIAVEAAATAEADMAKAELSNLKTQIHPHFLFNTLNNIYSLAVMKDEHTAESILRLSNIMRYVTDDATENFVSLQNEINFISDYIALQKLRLGAKTIVEYTIAGTLESKLIAPLILITFVENVFKYGISNREESVITIKLTTDESSINFFCRNRLFPYKPPLERTGIGIINTRKRLDYLYAGKYQLTIKEENEFYSVYLQLET